MRLLVLLLVGGCSGPAGPAPDISVHDGPVPDQVGLEVSPDTASRPDGGTTLGAPCTSELDCSTGLRCEEGFPGGLCTCDCTEDKDCGDMRHVGCMDGLCRQRCNPRAIVNPCRTDYVCRLEQTRGLCVADCRVHGCTRPAPWICDQNSGLCLDPTSGTLGAACGATTGTCDGTPNGVCYTVNLLTDGFCTIPCSPFTLPCPSQIPGAECLVGAQETPLCAFLCDPQAPSCPHPDLTCSALGDLHVCLPPM